MTNAEISANELIDLYRRVLDKNLSITERIEAAEKGFYALPSVLWDEECRTSKTHLELVFTATKLKAQLHSNIPISVEVLDILIRRCEMLLSFALPYDDFRCDLLIVTAKLYILRIEVDTVEYLITALKAINQLPDVAETTRLYPQANLITIMTDLLREKLYLYTRKWRYISKVKRIEPSLHACLQSKDEVVIFDASQIAGEYYLLTLQGERAENIERALEIFEAQQQHYDSVRATLWCKICEKLGDTYAARLRGDKYVNIKKAVDCYNTAVSIADEAPSAKYPHKQKTLNTLKLVDMLIERNEYGDLELATELVWPILNEDNTLEVKYYCYRAYVGVRVYSKHNISDPSTSHRIIFENLDMMDSTSRFLYEDRFYYETKILATNAVLHSRLPQRDTFLQEDIVYFQGVLKKLSSDAFPVESIKMHILCGEILRKLSQSTYKQQLAQYKAALHIAEKCNLKHHLADIYFGIGRIYESPQSEFHSTTLAKEAYQKAIEYIAEHQLDKLMQVRLHLIAIHCMLYEWHAALRQSMEILSFIDAKDRSQEVAYVLNAMNQTDASLLIPLIPYVYFVQSEVEGGLAAIELLKMESIHHKLLYETRPPDDEDLSQALNLFSYQITAKHIVAGCGNKNQMNIIGEDALKAVQSIPPDFQKKYGFFLELKDIGDQLEKLEEWVFIPNITLLGTCFVLIPPNVRGQQIILSDPNDFDDLNLAPFFHIASTWVESIVNLDRDDVQSVKTLNDLASTMTQLFYKLLGSWIGRMIVEHEIPKNERMVVVPFGSIAHLPIGLTAIYEDGTLLQDYFTLSIAPSITAINGVRNRLQDIHDSTITHIYSPDSSLEDNKESKESKESKHFALERSVISSFLEESCVQSQEATDSEAIFSNSKLFNNTYLHIQLHGIYHFAFPDMSSLSLADGSNITTSEMVKMAPTQSQRVVTLTSCEGGMADVYKGVGTLSGIPTVMMLMGAIGVIAPLWQVGNAATCILMIRFYDNHFSKRISPPQALKDAQLWIREATADDIIAYIGGLVGRNDNVASKLDELVFMLEEDFDSNDKPFSKPIDWAGFIYYGL